MRDARGRAEPLMLRALGARIRTGTDDDTPNAACCGDWQSLRWCNLAPRAPHRTTQTSGRPDDCPFVPGTQTGGLHVCNVFGDGDDRAMRAALDAASVARVREDADLSEPQGPH